MIVIGAARGALTWLVAGYLVALATVVVPGLAVLGALDGSPAAVHTAVATLVLAGPIAGLLAAWRTRAAVYVAAAVGGDASPAPDAVVGDVAEHCARAHVTAPVCRVAPGLGPGDRPVVVGGPRRAVAFLPAGADDEAARQVAVALADGGGHALRASLTVHRWLRIWLDVVRLAVSPARSARRGSGAGALAAQVVAVPFALLAAVFVIPAYLASWVAGLLVGPGRLRDAVRVLGTGDARARAREQVTAPDAWDDTSTPWAVQNTLASVRVVGRPAADDGPWAGRDGGRGWGRPARVAAGLAPAGSVALAACLLFLAPATGFAGAAVADHLLWPGERTVTARVVTADPGLADGADSGYVVDLAEDRHVTLAVPDTRWRASFVTARTPRPGDAVTVVVPSGADPADATVDVRWPDRRSVARSIAQPVLALLLAWTVIAGVTRFSWGGVARSEQEERGRTTVLAAVRRGGDAAGEQARRRWQERTARAARRRFTVGAAAAGLVVGAIAGIPGGALGAAIGDQVGRTTGFLVTVTAVVVAVVVVARRVVWPRREQAARAGTAGRPPGHARRGTGPGEVGTPGR